MNVFELFGTIAIKNRDANAALNDTATRAERTGNRIQAAFKKIGETSVKIAKPIIKGVTAAATAITATVETTRDYRTEMAKLETAFKTHGFTVDEAKETYRRLQAVLGETDQSVEAANHIAAMANNAEDLSKWTDICTGIFATFGDSLPIESLTEAANETSKTGQLTGGLADALNWAGISEDDFQKKLDACTSEEERQNLIMDTLYWTYRKASDQYKETGDRVMKANEAQEKLNSAMALLGDTCEPIVTGVKGWIADMVTAAVPHLDTMIAKFNETGDVWTSVIWPLTQGTHKILFGTELPDWETFKANLKKDWEAVKQMAEKDIVLKAILEAPGNYAQIAKDIATGWDTVIVPAIKDMYKTIFGVDMPSWEQIVTDITNGWNNTIWPGIQNLFKITFGVDMPSWNDIAMKIAMGWDSVMNSISSMFNVALNFGNGTIGDATGGEFGGGTSDGTVGRRSFAGGLDRVPNDGYIARLHKNEAVLTAAEASVWRGGGSGRIEALLSELVNIMRAGQTIQLDSGILAGQLTPAIDARLGTVAKYKGRGN